LLAGRYAKEHAEKRLTENKEKKWKVAAFDFVSSSYLFFFPPLFNFSSLSGG
jgi:hypothetical protein